MKDFFKNKHRLIIVCMFVVLAISGCTNPKGADGKTKIDKIIAVNDTTILKSKVNIPTELEGDYKKYGKDEAIPIEATQWDDVFAEGWFQGLIVYPLTQIINFISNFTDGGMGIILTTLLIQLLIFLSSIKSQVSMQKMQELQPLMNKIEAKYANKTDDASKMQKMQELQGLYRDNKINPFGSILVTFIQLPVILGMYQATMRSIAVIGGSFYGTSLAITPQQGLADGQWVYIIGFVLMIVLQILSMKIPQWLQAYRKKKANVKEKKYAEPKKAGSGMAGSMNMMMYFSTIMIAVLAFSWPFAMTFYWVVNSLARIIQNIVIHKFFIKN